MQHLSALPLDSQVLRHNLAQPLARLRFTQPLETSLLEYLRVSQRRSALITATICCAIWCIFLVLDVLRFQTLAGSGHESVFFWRSFVPRCLVLVCFACALYALLNAKTSLKAYEVSVAGLILALSMSVVMSSYTLKNLGLPDTGVAMVLLVSVVFFPLGLRLRFMGGVAVAVCLCLTLAGPVLLRSPENLREHWVLVIVLWMAFVLSGMAAYFREKSLREQFLLRQLLNWEASHDPLTGLANRRMFHEHMDRCMRQAYRQGVPLYLVIFDIDHFKLYNDHYGHAGGDAALRQLSQLLLQFARRPLDLAVRLGGEEFGLVIYDMPVHTLTQHIAQLQAALAALKIEHKTSPTSPYLTVSAGAACIQAHDTQDTAFQRADSLLYQAKNQGRNQLVLQSLGVGGDALAA